jgi:hypothetical protein
MFATPVGYLIDETGVITADVAVGQDAIVNLLNVLAPMQPELASAPRPSTLRVPPATLRLVYGSFPRGPLKIFSIFANSKIRTSIGNVILKGFTDEK